MSALALAAVLALATDPQCGAAAPDSELAHRLQATAVHESGDDRTYADPLAIGVNADLARGLHPARLHFASSQEAIAGAYSLLAQRRSFDLGLMMINVRSLAQDGLSIDAAFDACRNMAAGAHHFVADVHTVLNLAHRLYNTGSTERGANYASAIEAVLIRIQAAGGGAGQAASPPPPVPPSCAPSWDVWAVATCSDRASAQPGAAPARGVVSVSINTRKSTDDEQD